MIKYINNALLHGMRTVFYNGKFVLLLWTFNLVSALILAVPIYNMLFDNLGTSLMSKNLIEQFDLLWYAQLRNLYSIHFDQLTTSIYAVTAVYTFFQTFFVGGLISIFHLPEKNHMVDFFYGGVKYFWRFAKVLVICVILLFIAFEVNYYLGELISLIFSKSENVTGDFILKFIRYILLIFFIGIVIMISDYSKVNMAVHDKTKVLTTILDSMKFIIRNFSKVFIVFLIISILGAIGVIVYNILGKLIPRTPSYYLIISIILQQMLIIFRLFIRMYFFSTAVSIFKDLDAKFVNADIERSEQKL